MSLVIVDIGTGNVGSVANMCRRLGTEPVVTADPAAVASAGRLLLPGVGAFDHAMARLEGSGLTEVLHARVAAGVPLLGICLGMQLLLEASEEGDRPGLGWIQGKVCRLPADTAAGRARIPHMGWSRLVPARPHPLLGEGPGSVGSPAEGEDPRFYFVHSYAAVPVHEDDVVARTVYGEPFVSVVARRNVMGVQFHPEKSHRHGKAMLRRFLELS